MLFKIACPKCETEGSFSLADPGYEGPYRCWKCRELFAIEIAGNELQSCQPMSQEEFEQQQAAQSLRKKFNQ